MKKSKLYKKLVEIYDKDGASGIFKYAIKNPRQFENVYAYCHPCEEETPTILRDDCCAVCGTSRD